MNPSWITGTRARPLRVGHVSFGRPTFDLAAAQDLSKRLPDALDLPGVERVATEGLVTDAVSTMAAAETLQGRIDILLAQFTTFVDGRWITLLAKQLGVPVLAWAIREPNRAAGQRLSLNSLTGANMAGRCLREMGLPFQFVYGDAGEERFEQDMTAAVRFWQVWQRLQKFTVVTLGDAPDGFFFANPSGTAGAKFGIRVEHLDLAEVFQRAGDVPVAEVERELATVAQKVRGLASLPPASVEKYARMMTLLKAELRRCGADAVAVRCWPEFFTEFGAAACSTISALTDIGVMGACESDVLGALSMDVLASLTGGPAYLGDLVEIQEEHGAVVFWHCGAGAFSLARPEPGAVAGKHPNRDIGFTLEFGLKPGEVTVLRIGEDVGGQVRALIGRGEVLDVPQRFRGTSATVRLHPRSGGGGGTVLHRVTRVIEAGFEPHYAIAYGNVADSLERLCDLLKIPATHF